MHHGNTKPEREKKAPQLGSGFAAMTQQGDNMDSPARRRHEEDMRQRGLTDEDRGYPLQMG